MSAILATVIFHSFPLFSMNKLCIILLLKATSQQRLFASVHKSLKIKYNTIFMLKRNIFTHKLTLCKTFSQKQVLFGPSPILYFHPTPFFCTLISRSISMSFKSYRFSVVTRTKTVLADYLCTLFYYKTKVQS